MSPDLFEWNEDGFTLSPCTPDSFFIKFIGDEGTTSGIVPTSTIRKLRDYLNAVLDDN